MLAAGKVLGVSSLITPEMQKALDESSLDWQVHLMNAPGFNITKATLTQAITLLLTWHIELALDKQVTNLHIH